MMFKHEVIRRITEGGVVAVVRAETPDDAIEIARACIDGGLPAIEVTFTVPHATKVIESLSQAFTEKELIIGAGTVLDSETARLAILSGAKYIVSPGFNRETALLCNRYQIPYMPGCMTITEMITAMEYGADIIKLFPGSSFEPSFIKAVKGPLPHVNLMPTGGVSLSNIADWVKNGVVAVGVGSELTAPAKKGDFAQVTQLAEAFVKAFKDAKNKS